MNFITSLKLCLKLKCGTILPTKLTNMQKQGLQKEAEYCFILFYLFFTMFSTLLFQDSLNESGSATPNCFSRSFPRAVHNWTDMVVGFVLGHIFSWATHIFIISLCHAWASTSVCNKCKDTFYVL